MFKIKQKYKSEIRPFDYADTYFDYKQFRHNLENKLHIFTSTCGVKTESKTLIPNLISCRRIIKLFNLYTRENRPSQRDFKIEYVK